MRAWSFDQRTLDPLRLDHWKVVRSKLDQRQLDQWQLGCLISGRFIDGDSITNNLPNENWIKQLDWWQLDRLISGKMIEGSVITNINANLINNNLTAWSANTWSTTLIAKTCSIKTCSMAAWTTTTRSLDQGTIGSTATRSPILGNGNLNSDNLIKGNSINDIDHSISEKWSLWQLDRSKILSKTTNLINDTLVTWSIINDNSANDHWINGNSANDTWSFINGNSDRRLQLDHKQLA